MLLCLVGGVAFATQAQHSGRVDKPGSIDGDKTDEQSRPFSEMEEEMRAKRAIKDAEKDYQDNLERARDLSSLGLEVIKSYQVRKSLSDEDLKKLEKVEKLAKGIRRAAGGSEDDVLMEKPPKDLPAAMEMFACLSASLKQKVEKTPKHVISAAVIDQANVLLELIQILRTIPAKV